jgi:hypothetical protein
MTSHNRQRVTQGRAGGALGAAVIPAPAIVDNQSQFRSVRSRGRPPRGFLLPLRGNCGALTRSALLFVSQRDMRSRLQFHRIGYQPGSYVSDPFEAHSQRPFLESRSNDPEHGIGKVVNVQQGVGETRYV